MMGQEDKELIEKAYYKAGVSSLGKLCDFLFNCGLLEKEVPKGTIQGWYKNGLSSYIKNIIKLFLSKEDFENYQKLQSLSANALKSTSENTPSKTPALKSNKTITYYPNVYASAGFGTINKDNTECVVFDASLLSVVNIPKNSEMIQIKGDSMLPFVENGEFAIIERTSVAKNGDIVIANYGGELYIKHFQRNPAKKTISLISSNPSYPSFEISEDENLTIIGVLKATIRPR